MTTPELLGLAEIADLYGVSKNSANAWTRRHDFPQPITKLAMGPVWNRDQVVAWRRPVDQYEAKVTSPSGQVVATYYDRARCQTCEVNNTEPVQGTLWTDDEGQLRFVVQCTEGHRTRHYISLEDL